MEPIPTKTRKACSFFFIFYIKKAYIILSTYRYRSTKLFSVSCQVSAKFGTCTVEGLNGAFVEAIMFTFTLE